jgi:hypothetical protein
MSFDSYIALVSDYFFSSKKISEYSKQQQQTLDLAVNVLTTHGMGGKFVEGLIRHRFSLKDDGSIHGWDGWDGKIPVEIKTETINASKQLNCEASFSTNTKNKITKKDIFLRERPHLYSVGVHDVSGKCLYVMRTETSKLKKTSTFFERLAANSPRISFFHWKGDLDAYTILYKNQDLVRDVYFCFAEDLGTTLGYKASLEGM